jgi:hypothetical protein
MCKYFGIAGKVQHDGFSLWKRCIAGNKTAWATMKRYNKNDTGITEELYLKLRPFMRTHPNFGTFKDKLSCPKCGSEKVHSRGYARNSTTIYKRAQCQSCSGWFRYGKNVVKLKNKRMNV